MMKLKLSMNLQPLQKLAKKSPEHFKTAMSKGAIQFLNWANTGSRGDSRKPPIRWGVLRGSSSAFLDGKLLSIYPQAIGAEADEKPTPARSAPQGGSSPTATWAWNTDYATKMHEWMGTFGEATQRDGDAGNKWLERHLQADKDNLFKMIATEFKKAAGT